MKKLILFALTAFIVMMSFNSCGSPDPVYSESWYSTEGYVEKDEDGKFVRFVETTNIPTNQTKAIRWEHRYKDQDIFYTLTPQQWDGENISWIDIEKRPYVFSFQKTPRNINDLIFYCDDENIYIINNKFNEYRLKERKEEDEYRFKIKVDFISEILDIRMIKLEKKW